MSSKKELEKGYSGLATAALIMAIVGWLVLGIILEPIALVFAIMSQKTENNTTRTVSTIALIISLVGLLLVVIFFFAAMGAYTSLR